MEISQPSLKELLAQRQTLQQQVTAARQREAEVALADIVRKMHEYQISIADLMGRPREPKSQDCSCAEISRLTKWCHVDRSMTGAAGLSTRIGTIFSFAPDLGFREVRLGSFVGSG